MKLFPFDMKVKYKSFHRTVPFCDIRTQRCNGASEAPQSTSLARGGAGFGAKQTRASYARGRSDTPKIHTATHQTPVDLNFEYFY